MLNFNINNNKKNIKDAHIELYRSFKDNVRGGEMSASPKCAKCGKELHGISLRRIRELSKSQKRVSRKYGGYLCTNCTREKIKQEVRKKEK